MIDAIDNDTDLIFCILEGADHAGHTTGFGAYNPEYIKAIQDGDKYALAAIQHIEQRKTYDEEDWLIIVTTDHGGHDKTHFDQSADDKYTFIALNKKDALKSPQN